MAKLTPDQFRLITLYHYGLRPGRPPGVPHISRANGTWYVKIRWDRFDVWNLWQDRGKPPPRPGNVWTQVPSWDGWTPWDLRKEILRARPHTPPVPPIPPVPPVPPLPANAAQFQFGIYLGQNVALALNAPPIYKHIYTADPAYDDQATPGNANASRVHGSDVQVWFVPTQVSLGRAQYVASKLGASAIIGQSESADEFWASWNAGLRAVIGNLSAIQNDAAAMNLVRTGQMVFVNENYWNCQPGLQLDDHSLPIPSHVIGVYSDGDCTRRSLAEYQAAGRFHRGDGIYGPGATAEDYRGLPG